MRSVRHYWRQVGKREEEREESIPASHFISRLGVKKVHIYPNRNVIVCGYFKSGVFLNKRQVLFSSTAVNTVTKSVSC